jgi:hypothetical protein
MAKTINQLEETGVSGKSSGSGGPILSTDFVLVNDSTAGNATRKVQIGNLPVSAGSSVGGPEEVWVGDIMKVSSGADPSSLYLQSTEISHTGTTTGIAFNNTQDQSNIVVSGGAGGATYIITVSAWDTIVGATLYEKFAVYLDDTHLLGHTISTVGSGAGNATNNLVCTLTVASSATSNLCLYSSTSTAPTESDWTGHWKIERY